jgi:hypothetical protein
MYRRLLWGCCNNDCFTGWGCQPHAQPPAILEDQCFLLGLSLLAGWSQFESVRNSLFNLAWLSRENVAQESWRGRACIGLGRNRWHYPSFDSTHPPARCVPLGPHTTRLTPISQKIVLSKSGMLLTQCILWYQDITKCLHGKVILTSVWFQMCCHLEKGPHTFRFCVMLRLRSRWNIMWRRSWVSWRRMLAWWRTIQYQSNCACKSALMVQYVLIIKSFTCHQPITSAQYTCTRTSAAEEIGSIFIT